MDRPVLGISDGPRHLDDGLESTAWKFVNLNEANFIRPAIAPNLCFKIFQTSRNAGAVIGYGL